MIETVTKNICIDEFCSYQVTYVNSKRVKSCTTRRSKHRLPSNSDMDSRWWNSNR